MPIEDPMAELLKPVDQGGVGIAAMQKVYAKPNIRLKLFHADKYGDGTVDIDLILKKASLLMGQSGSGKSNAAGRILEQLLSSVKPPIPIFVLDIEGEHESIVQMYQDAFTGQGYDGRIRLSQKLDDKIEGIGKQAAQDFIHSNKSMWLDLAKVPRNIYMVFLDEFLTECYDLKSGTDMGDRAPHIFFIDECHNFIPEAANYDDQHSKHAKHVREAVRKYAIQGRKFGARVILLTQRPALAEKNTISQVGVRFLLQVTDPLDVDQYRRLVPGSDRKELQEELFRMKPGQCKFVADGKLASRRFMQKDSKDLAGTPGIAEHLRLRSGTENNMAKHQLPL